MTEAAMVYNEDMKQKSSIRKSANSKKGGSNTMKLGNKPMSWQEIASKHGECKTWNLDSFMSFSDFKAMPQDLQVEYVNKLQDKYDIGIKHISRELFNVGDDGLQSHLRMHNILKFCNPDKRRGKTGYQKFLDDIAAYKKGDKLAKILDLADSKPVEPSVPEFMSYADYCKFTPEERLQYVNSLINHYHVGLAEIAFKLFGLNKSTLGVYFGSKKLLDRVIKVYDLEKKKEQIAVNNVLFEEAIDIWKGNKTFAESLERIFEPKPEKDSEPIVEKTPVVESVPEIKMEVPEPINMTNPDPEPVIPAEPVKEPDPMEFHDISFTSEYIRRGLDIDEFNKLAMLFEGKRVRVHLVISEV